jgi:phosphoribosylaminoimidazolecarboxamide formyltransferase/IMP cyclohydrolase
MEKGNHMAINKVDKIDDLVLIQRVLISVSDKTGLEAFIPALIKLNPKIEIFSTGGTFQTIREILGQDTKRLIQVSDYTGQPETQGGLVKTLDFKIYLGLLTETYNPSHQADLARTHAVPIDMVVVNLYPFQETVARPNITLEEARGNIDIGGPCMIRASAKNFLRVASVVTPADYGLIIEDMTENGGGLTLKHRFALAQKAFAHTAEYDQAIAEYLGGQIPASLARCYKI